MKINYMCYSIRKFFLIFLAITCQVGIINASGNNKDVKDDKNKLKEKKLLSGYNEQLRKESEEGMLTILQSKKYKSVINYKEDDFINKKYNDSDDDNLKTAFQLAADSGHEDLFKELLKFDKLKVNEKYKDGTVPLISLIHFKLLDLVKLMIDKISKDSMKELFTFEKKGFSVNDKTVLMYAIDWFAHLNEKFSFLKEKKNLKGIIETLLDHSKDQFRVVNNNKYTALTIALEKLIECNAKKFDDNEIDNNTIKDFVVNSLIEIIPKLIDNTIVNLKSGNLEKTALMLAIMTKQQTLVDKLIEQGAKVDIEDKNGRTAIFYAIEHYDESIYKEILSHTKKLNKEDNSGNTPLKLLFSLEDEVGEEKYKNLKNEFTQKLNASSKNLINDKNKQGFTLLNIMVYEYISNLKEKEKSEKATLTSLEKEQNQNQKKEKEKENLKNEFKLERKKLNKKYIPRIKTLLDAGADPAITFKDSKDNDKEKTVISLITDELVEKHEELGSLKSSLEEARENCKKRKDKNKDTPTQDQDPSQNQDGGNGINIGTVVIIIAAVGSLVVGAIVAVPLLFKKQKATKGDSAQSKDNTAKPKPIST